MRSLLVILVAGLVAGFAAPAAAKPPSVEVGAQVAQRQSQEGVLAVTADVKLPFSAQTTIGSRNGLALLSERDPILALTGDVVLGVTFGEFYFEAVGGPWMYPDQSRFVAHLAGGVGAMTKSVRVGIEGGWLDRQSIVGLRFAIKL